MESNTKIIDEINKEEIFTEAKDIKLDPNAVFVEFNSTIALEKLLNIKKLTMAEKLSYAKHLGELLETIGDELLKNLKKILENFLMENKEVLQALLDQIPIILIYLNRISNYKEITTSIIPTLSVLISNEDMGIKTHAGEIIGDLIKILSEEDRGKYILTLVLNMAHDDTNENNRIVAVQLLSSMASCFGKDLCEQFVGLEILSLGDDKEIRVRKEAINNLANIAQVVSDGFFKERLLPFYLKKVNDSSWIVRKACVENIVIISNISETPIRENFLTQVLLKLLKDTNKWVKIAAYKCLGPFISTLAGMSISEKLFENYCQMTTSSLNSLASDNEIMSACSFYFPAVLAAFGAEKWPAMSKMFYLLIKKPPEVRKALACSLHEIALIIGPEKAEKDLIPILEAILQDHIDDVKFGAIKNLAKFLEVFSNEKREHFVDVFLNLQKDPKKWRIRELIANQIKKLATIYSSDIILQIISPISFKLCTDPVNIVREKACKKIYSVVLSLKPPYQEIVVENIKGFFVSKKFNLRQSFLIMVGKIMKYPEIFKQYFVENFIELSEDKVPNVRITLAKVVKKHYIKKGKMMDDPEIVKLVKKLKNDKQRDVSDIVKDILIPCSEEKEKIFEEIKLEDQEKSPVMIPNGTVC